LAILGYFLYLTVVYLEKNGLSVTRTETKKNNTETK
jgi:hypothetical protein